MRRPLTALLLALAFAPTLATGGGGTASARSAAQGPEAATGAEAALTGVRQIDAGSDHNCAVLTSGQARCWGSGVWRQLGNGLTSSPGIPNVVLNTTGTGALTGITQVSGGGNHTCARLSSGQVRCWGYNGEGALGVGDQSTRTFPSVVKGVGGTGRLTGVTQVAAGWDHTCARVAGGQVRCWGNNSQGQIGDDTNALRSTPVAVLAPTGPGPLTGATQLAAALQFSCARLDTGRAVCWGNNGNYQVGDGTNSDRDRPVFVRNSQNTGPLTGVRQVTAGNFFACALLTSGQARCWGNGPFGASEFPVGVLNASGSGPLTGITSISAGANHICLRLASGRVRCFGVNASGQLGDLTFTGRPNPVLMVNTNGTNTATGVTAVSTGDDHTCARLSSGQVMCTGANDLGQLGAGPGPNTARPIGVRR